MTVDCVSRLINVNPSQGELKEHLHMVRFNLGSSPDWLMSLQVPQ